jgi:glycerol-3-phosphate O-acyltransferase/dihydroxyacetone phosphate acyltransferase
MLKLRIKNYAIFIAHFLCMVWHFIKYWITFVIPAFYKKIQGRNIKNLQVKGPVIIAMNHPNAFTDPIAITSISYPQRLHYLARGDAFKPGLAAWLLEQIGIVPIFRIQDGGVEGLKKNDEAYRRVNQLLKSNAKIIVFAEGICVQERRLRPLKKGVSRMTFGAYESLPHDQLVVVPVGVNYSHPGKFRSTVFYNVGEPIAVKDFIALYRENPAKANTKFLQTLEPKMRELITHINDKQFDQAVYFVEALCKRNWIREQQLNHKNMEHDFTASKHFTELINTAAEKDPGSVHEFMTGGKAYFDELNRNGLRDWLIDPQQNKSTTPLNVMGRQLLLLLGFPVYLTGMLTHYPTYRLTKALTKKIVKKNVEFYSSIFMGVAMVTFLLTYILLFVLVYLAAPNVLWPLSACLLLALCAWFSLYYHTFQQKTWGMRRVLKDKGLVARMSEKRRGLMELVNKF